MMLDQVEEAIRAIGLIPRGVAGLEPEEQSGPLADKQCVVLIGMVGRAGWEQFASSPEAADGKAHPLDRWSRRTIDALATDLGAEALYPFAGPPFWPFQRWAKRAEPLSSSPLGLLIHPVYGLWHSYRGALAFSQDFAAPPPAPVVSPCDTCPDKPCLSACPVRAFSATGYDVDACARWLRDDAGAQCMTGGCRARSACPVGAGYAHAPDQAQFGMRAFLAAR